MGEVSKSNLNGMKAPRDKQEVRGATMLDKKVVQFKARMRDITAAQECEAEEGRRDDDRVVQFKPSMA